MDGPHALEHVLTTLTELVNTSPRAAGVEELGDLSAARGFIKKWIVTDVEPPTNADLAALHASRRRFRAVFAAPDVNTKVALVNDILASAPIQPRLASHNGLGLHIHYFMPHASLADHLNADCSMALAELISAGEGTRLRVCKAPECARVLVDFSRNRSRLYCDSRRCGNRIHAAAYRARKHS